VKAVSDWKSVLKADPVDWLLEKDNPSVRYFTLSQLLDKPKIVLKCRKPKKKS
jgi:hypothetical protein